MKVVIKLFGIFYSIYIFVSASASDANLAIRYIAYITYYSLTIISDTDIYIVIIPLNFFNKAIENVALYWQPLTI
ncbi:hypothetical protein CRN79_19690 [Serratia fonticola]|nr:hypothetical protein CRN79_19690 [Serratia fonticola]